MTILLKSPEYDIVFKKMIFVSKKEEEKEKDKKEKKKKKKKE